MKTVNKTQKGFTLIEILVVVSLIAILAAVTIVSVNSAKNFADTRNATRSSDVNSILNAVTQYLSEQGNTVASLGTIPACSPGPAAAIGSDTGNVNLGTTLVPSYIVSIPKDPSNGTDANTGYTICITETNRIQISAPSAENGKIISVQR